MLNKGAEEMAMEYLINNYNQNTHMKISMGCCHSFNYTYIYRIK